MLEGLNIELAHGKCTRASNPPKPQTPTLSTYSVKLNSSPFPQITDGSADSGFKPT